VGHFGSSGDTNIGGQRVRRVHVGNSESAEDARGTLTESLDDIAPLWRRHLRLLDVPED
jgi:hypothetical protein